MAKLIITRNCKFFDWSRDYKIFLNGEKIGTISDGETEEFNVPEGTGILKAKIGWRGSPELKITISNEETKTISLSGFKYERILSILMSVVIVTSILFRDFISKHFLLKYLTLIFLGMILLAVMYHLTFGRNKYIAIKEDPCQAE